MAPLQYSRLENSMNSMKRQKDRTLKDELPRLVGTQYATGEEWRNMHSLALPFFGIGMKTDLFQSGGHC